MKLIRIEETFDGRKVVFTTLRDPDRLSQLVQDLAVNHPIRIEMRQVGPRDETKLRGGLGPCGLTLCCSTFLKLFTRHDPDGEEQNLSLNLPRYRDVRAAHVRLAYEEEGYRTVQPRFRLLKRG